MNQASSPAGELASDRVTLRRRRAAEPGRFELAPGECGTTAVWRITRPAA